MQLTGIKRLVFALIFIVLFSYLYILSLTICLVHIYATVKMLSGKYRVA